MGKMKWDAAADAVVREFAGQESAASIGRRIGCSKDSVLGRLQKLGIQGLVQGVSRIWTEQHFAALRAIGEGVSARDFARQHKLHEESVRYWGRKFGTNFRPAAMWTESQVEILKTCRTAAEAMLRLGRTRRSVTVKAHREGITFTVPRSGRPRAPRTAVSAPKPSVAAEMNEKAGKAVRVVETQAPAGRLEWCKRCNSPVVSWHSHYERMPECSANFVPKSNPFGLSARP